MTRKKLPYEQVYISGAERYERVLALLPSAGFANLNQLARDMGIDLTQLKKTLESESPYVASVCRMAHSLGCTVNYLSER